MKKDFTLLWGGLLIAAGVLFLVQSLTNWGGGLGANEIWATIWAVAFAGAGLTFGWVFLSDRVGSWWAAIPSLVLLALGVLTGGAGFGIDPEGVWFGPFFLAMIGLSFWIVYAVKREFWWAIIPGGTLFTLAIVAVVTRFEPGDISGAVFFFGLALTFVLVWAVRTERGHMGWALYPAAALALLGALVLFSVGTAANYVTSLALIAAGLWLLFRQFGSNSLAHRR